MGVGGVVGAGLGGGLEVSIYLCGLGHALAEDFDLYIAQGGVECDGHGGWFVPDAFAAGGLR